MDKEIKQHILSLLDTGHKHAEMTQMILCSYCGKRFKKAESAFERLKDIYPDKFGYEMPAQPESVKVRNMRDRLEDRIKHDSAYRKHLDILAQGTPEEKRKEWHKEEAYGKQNKTR